jgi:ribosomal protein S18 acetylase RimI-like enzyme
VIPRVREALPCDFPLIRDLAADAGLSSVSSLRRRLRAEIQEEIRRTAGALPMVLGAGTPFRLFTAIDEKDAFIGYLLLKIEIDCFTGQKQVLVVDYAVVPEFRRRGVGNFLIEKAELHARQEGIGAVAALVTSSNEPSLRAFLKRDYMEECVLLLKRLS